MVLTRGLKRKLCGEAEPSSGTDATTTTTSKRLRVSHDAAAESSSSTTTNTTTSKRLRVSHDAAAEPSSGTTTNITTSKRLRVSHDAAAEPSSSTTTNITTSKRLRVSHDAAAESSSSTDATTTTSKRLRVSHDAAAESSSSTTTNITTSKRLRVSHDAAAEPSSGTDATTTTSKRLRVSHDAAAEPSSGNDATTTTTTTSKRLRVSHDAAAEPSSSSSTTTTTRKRLRGSHAAESGGKKRKMEAPDASSSRRDPRHLDAGKAPDASSGLAKKWKASRPKQPRCRRCRQLIKEERRVWQSLKATGVPLLTRSEVAMMCRGEGRILGSGGFGRCEKGRDPSTGLDVVVKSFHTKGFGALEEAATLWAMRHVPGLQRLVGACVQSNELVTLFAGENLNQYFGTITRRPVATALSVFQQTTRTLQAMGEAGYAHNDIKPCNACAWEQEGRSAPEVTVIDVGLALPVGSRSPFKQIPDPDRMPWVAPELLLHTGRCGEASDAYGLAFLMQELLILAKSSPLLAPVHAWVKRARSRDPHARPGLAKLQKVLQTALAKEGKQ